MAKRENQRKTRRSTGQKKKKKKRIIYTYYAQLSKDLTERTY